jgi:hypothetical protein
MDVNGRLLRALFRRHPLLDLLRAEDAGLRGAHDRVVLEWAATEGRILLSQDRKTLVGYAYERVRAGLPMPGVFMARRRATIRRVLDDLLLLYAATEQDEWRDKVEFLPL